MYEKKAEQLTFHSMAEETSTTPKPRKAVFIKVDPDDEVLQEFIQARKELKLLEEGQVRVKMTPEEKKKKKRDYCKVYGERDEVKKKKEKRKNDPDQQKKAEEYSKLPRVVERRTALATERRAVPSHLKRDHPDIWAKYCPLASAPRKRETNKRPKEEGEVDKKEPAKKKQRKGPTVEMEVDKKPSHIEKQPKTQIDGPPSRRNKPITINLSHQKQVEKHIDKVMRPGVRA